MTEHRKITLNEWNDIVVSDDLQTEIREALEGDSNDAEHDALVSVAQELGIELSTDEMAAEFQENGLDDVADYLRAHGAVATRRWIDSVIAEAAENDDPEGWRLGNLEVARDRLDTKDGIE